jgi:flavin reductase (DIM6/NTAB) family NADH-FMN oxidoreductase RutF
MAEVEKIEQEPKYWDRLFASPGILGIITTIDSGGRVNAAAFGTVARVVHDPVQIAFTTNTTRRDTYENIKQTGEFVVNLPSFERSILEKVCVVGLPFAPGVNELEKAGLTALPSRVVKPPRIKECPRNFECRVVWTKEWLNRVMIVGNVVAASVDADCVDEQGFVKWDTLKAVTYCGAPYNKLPPYQHMFVAAYETMTVPTPYEGPEVEAYDANVARLKI